MNLDLGEIKLDIENKRVKRIFFSAGLINSDFRYKTFIENENRVMSLVIILNRCFLNIGKEITKAVIDEGIKQVTTLQSDSDAIPKSLVIEKELSIPYPPGALVNASYQATVERKKYEES